MNPANFYTCYMAGVVRHGTPPKEYGQMLKANRRKRKIRKKNV